MNSFFNNCEKRRKGGKEERRREKGKTRCSPLLQWPKTITGTNIDPQSLRDFADLLTAPNQPDSVPVRFPDPVSVDFLIAFSGKTLPGAENPLHAGRFSSCRRQHKGSSGTTSSFVVILSKGR